MERREEEAAGLKGEVKRARSREGILREKKNQSGGKVLPCQTRGTNVEKRKGFLSQIKEDGRRRQMGNSYGTRRNNMSMFP